MLALHVCVCDSPKNLWRAKSCIALANRVSAHNRYQQLLHLAHAHAVDGARNRLDISIEETRAPKAPLDDLLVRLTTDTSAHKTSSNILGVAAAELGLADATEGHNVTQVSVAAFALVDLEANKQRVCGELTTNDLRLQDQREAFQDSTPQPRQALQLEEPPQARAHIDAPVLTNT